MLEKSEEIKGDLRTQDELFEEIMTRDFADSQLVNGATRLSLVNSSGVKGWANFMASRLAWAGMTVVGAVTGEKTETNCRLVFSQVGEVDEYLSRLRKLLDCDEMIDSSLSEGEMELVLGQREVEMLNYSTYINPAD